MPRLLLVEDEETTVVLLTRMLEQAGYTVEVAKNGLEAIELLSTSLYDALIADVMMPRMHGRELCERVRAEPELRDLPIVIVTGVSEPDQLSWVEDLEPVELLAKPIRVQQLLERLERRIAAAH